MSADPLAVHAPGEADLNLYAYVSGRVLQAVDPVGLAEEELVERREVDPEAGKWESEFRGDDYTRIEPSQFDRSEPGDPTYLFDQTPEDRIEGRGQSSAKKADRAPSPPSRAAPAPAPSASSPEQTSIEPPTPSAPPAAAPSAPTPPSAGGGGSSKSDGLEAAKGFLDVISMLPIPFLGSVAAVASVAIAVYQGNWGEAALGVAGAAAGIVGAGVLVKGAALAGRALKARKVAKGIDLGLRNTATALRSASDAYEGTTRLGHALSKHAGRNPDIQGKVTGNPSTWHDQALVHFRDIARGPGAFENVVDAKTGLPWIEKRLSDGRGMRLNCDYTFKGFVD